MTPEFRAMIEQAAARQAQLAEERETPAAEQARVESATAFESQTAAEALETATEELTEVVSESAGRAFDVLPASEVEHYYNGDTAARVDVPGEPADVFVQSTLPLRGETESGGEAPVDLGLTEEGDVLEPQTPIVETTIPEQLEDEVALDDSGVGFSPQGAETAAPAQVEHDTAFYANAGTDTDFMVRPAPTGAQALWQLRSADSPESVVLEFSLPAGAALEQGGELGGARIVRGDEELGQVTRPVAFDAEGWPVELTFEVDPNHMVIGIPHRSQDVAYPIVIDPVIQEGSSSFTSNRDGWESVQFPAAGQPGSGQIQTFYYAGNLIVRGNPGAYQSLEHGAWRYDSPGTESVTYHATYYNAAHTAHGSFAAMGMLRPDGLAWDSGTTNSPWFPDSPILTGSGFNHSTPIAHCIGPPSLYCLGGTPNNEAWLSGGTLAAGNHSGVFQVQSTGITVHIADFTPPTLDSPVHATSGNPGLPTGWVDEEELSVDFVSRDQGFGVKKTELSIPGLGPHTRIHACGSGGPSDRCPSQYPSQFSYDADDMNGGVNTVTARAMDALGNWSEPQSWQVKVDHSGPELALDGQLWERAGEQLGRATYGLQVDATDGTAEAPEDRRSGVKSIEVKVDGQREEYVEQPCPGDSCALSSDDFEFAAPAADPGQHTIEVIATDQLGHPSNESFQVETLVTPPPETLIDSGPRGLVSSAEAGFEFRASETDANYRCRLDQGEWEACASPKVYGGLPEGERRFEVQATDPWGNDDPSPAQRTWTVDTVPPEASIGGGPSGATNDSTPGFGLQSAEGGATFECQIDNSPFVGCSGPPYGPFPTTFTTAPLADGGHTIRVRARDRAGNLTSPPATRNFIVDTSPPAANITSGPDGTITNPSATYAFASSEGGSSFQCRFDGTAWTGCTSAMTYSGFGEGDYRFDVRAVDSAGNVGRPAVRELTYEAVAAGGDGGNQYARFSKGDDCSGRVDPVGVVFNGTKGRYNDVARNIRQHTGWDAADDGGDQTLWVDVRDSSGRVSRECHTPSGDQAQGCFVACSRYHVRLWNVPASSGANKKVAGTPHWEDLELECKQEIMGECVLEFWAHCPSTHGFSRGRRKLRDAFRDAGHIAKSHEISDDIKAITKCDDRVDLDGLYTMITVGHNHPE